ncbi:MAG: hypothetical protein JW781_06635 [Deltaproteobacteria bacterium]|nr:hypothetical protein [Candidatus Anaeroferrophillacea bacterium]
MASVCSFSPMNADKVEVLKKLEQELGATVLAFSCNDMATASLSDVQLARLQAAEKELGVSLVAVNA